MKAPKNIMFPIVTFSFGNHLFFFRNAIELSSCSRKGFKNGFYNNLIVIDSEGTEFKVDRAEIASMHLKERIEAFFSLKKLKVELFFNSETSDVQIEDLKLRIIESMESDIDLWDADGKLESRILEIKSEMSISNIISQQTSDFYKEYH